MLNSEDARRRWWGVFFLTLAMAFLIWGETLLEGFLKESKALFVAYWSLCFVSIALAVLIALVDMNVTRKRFRLQRKKLMEQTLLDLRKDVKK